MRILLDTNAFLWQTGLVGGGRLGTRAKQLMKTADAVFVSAVTVAELQIKAMLGKIEIPNDCSEAILQAGDVPLSFSPEAADEMRSLSPTLARHDPFDRMLLAQAQADGLKLLTGDEFLQQLGLPFVIDARK